MTTAEHHRLQDHASRRRDWKNWGPHLSERAWGTVREDYSEHGTAWDSFSHDDARSRTYRWNKDGLGGISDRHQHLCLAVALWNGSDPIRKERLFGGDTGAGLGASHQTGWTGLVASLLQDQTNSDSS